MAIIARLTWHGMELERDDEGNWHAVDNLHVDAIAFLEQVFEEQRQGQYTPDLLSAFLVWMEKHGDASVSLRPDIVNVDLGRVY